MVTEVALTRYFHRNCLEKFIIIFICFSNNDCLYSKCNVASGRLKESDCCHNSLFRDCDHVFLTLLCSLPDAKGVSAVVGGVTGVSTSMSAHINTSVPKE